MISVQVKINKVTRAIIKPIEILLLCALVSVLFYWSSLATVGYLQAEATSQPEASISITNPNLGADETATIEVLIKNEQVNNDIDQLLLRAYFNDQQNPSNFKVSLQADDLSAVNLTTDLQVPNDYYLDYVAGSTQVLIGEPVEKTTPVADINGVSPLAFTDGYVLHNLQGGVNNWLRLRFQVKAVASRPTVFHPDIEFFKYVANISAGESLTDKQTDTAIAEGETVVIQLFIHNQILESLAHNVRVIDEYPELNSLLTGSVISSEDGELTSNIQLTGTGELYLVEGSVVIKDAAGSILETLSSSEADELFTSGMLLNGNGELKGCWEFMRSIEYQVRLEAKGGVEVATISLQKKVIFNGHAYDSVDKAVNLYDPGEEVLFEMKVKNVGEELAEDVEIEDVLPLYLDFVTCSDHCDYDSGSRVVNWELGDLEVAEEQLVQLTAVVKDVLPQGDRTQENLATGSANNASSRVDNALIWINGPDIITTHVTEDKIIRQVEKQQVLAQVKYLPVDGPADPIINGVVWLLLQLNAFVVGLVGSF